MPILDQSNKEVLPTFEQANSIGAKIFPGNVQLEFVGGNPVLRLPDQQEFHLGSFEAAIWLALPHNGISYAELYSCLIAEYGGFLNRDTLDNDLQTAVKNLYIYNIIVLLLGSTEIEIVSWHTRSISECHFALTYKCNLRCRHCLIVQRSIPELSTEEILHTLDQLQSLGCQQVIYSGGEPFVRSDISLLLKRTSEIGMKYRFNSNATLITQEHFTLLERFPPENISISLYGPDSMNHDWVTRKAGSFDETIKNLKKLRAVGIPVNIKVMVLKSNINTLDKIQAIANKLDCKIFFDAHIIPRQDGRKQPLRLALPPRTLLRFFKSEFADPRPAVSSRRWAEPQHLVCSAGLSRCAINPYGEIFPCAVFPLHIGSLQSNNLSEILGQWRANYQTNLPIFSDYKDCLCCDHRNYCYPCPGISLIEEGNIRLKSRWVCSATKNKRLESGGFPD